MDTIDILFINLGILVTIISFIGLLIIAYLSLFSGWISYTESVKENEQENIRKLLNRFKFLGSAKQNLYMKYGELNSKVWADEKYLFNFKQLIEKGLKIKIIASNEIDVDDVELLKLAIDKKIELYYLDRVTLKSIEENHFIITDDKGVWISYKRPRFSMEKRGKYNFGPTFVAYLKKKKFLEALQLATLVDKYSIKNIKFMMHDPTGKSIEPVPASSEKIEHLYNYIGIS